MLLIILRVVYLLVCAGAILTYINPEEVEGVPVLLPKVINDNRLAAFAQVENVVDALVAFPGLGISCHCRFRN